MMAYPTICGPCLSGRHDECLEAFDVPEPPAIGGALCVCAHGGEESAFQRGVRERLETARCLICDSRFASRDEASRHYRGTGHRGWVLPASWTVGRGMGIDAVLGDPEA
jgi:hypothetical protein